MHVVFDNIIFALQKAGGISVVWQELLNRAIKDSSYQKTILDYPSLNVCRQALDLREDALTLPMRMLERYRQPAYQVKDNTIFHSSYFRILTQDNIQNITTIHDLTYHHYRSGLPKAVHIAQERYALAHSAGVICVSENTKRDLLSCYPHLQEDKVRVIYNGVGKHFMPLPKVEKKEFLLFVGNRAAAYKRFDVAVGVAQRTHSELVIIGSPLTSDEERYLNQALGRHQYRTVSNLPNEALNKYYNEALCLIYPSDYEGFGIPVIEAQKAGCPVICQDTSSLSEIAQGSALLVPHKPSNVLIDEMSSLVNQLRNGQIPMEPLRQKGFMNARRFSWDNTYRDTIDFYRSVLYH